MTASASNENTRTAKVRKLNDQFRKGFAKPLNALARSAVNRVLITSGIAALDVVDQIAIIAKVQAFDAFSSDNDPYGEHDFGAIEHGGRKVFWKIDYYAPDMIYGSDDPTDPSKTVRVLTIMLSEEY